MFLRMLRKIAEIVYDQAITAADGFIVRRELHGPRSCLLELTAERPPYPIDHHFFMQLLPQKPGDCLEMTVAGKEDVDASAFVLHGVLIYVVQHDKIGHILFMKMSLIVC